MAPAPAHASHCTWVGWAKPCRSCARSCGPGTPAPCMRGGIAPAVVRLPGRQCAPSCEAVGTVRSSTTVQRLHLSRPHLCAPVLRSLAGTVIIDHLIVVSGCLTYCASPAPLSPAPRVIIRRPVDVVHFHPQTRLRPGSQHDRNTYRSQAQERPQRLLTLTKRCRHIPPRQFARLNGLGDSVSASVLPTKSPTSSDVLRKPGTVPKGIEMLFQWRNTPH